MAACVPLHLRARVFSTNTALGYLGMAIGSLLAGATSLWNRTFPGASSFYPLFFLMFLSAIASMIVVATAPSEIRPGVKGANVQEKALLSSSLPPSKERTIRRQENKSIILILPLMPFYWLASSMYIVRSALSRGTQGARSALSSSLTRDERRGFSVSMNSLAVRLASAVGPTLSGYMLDMDILTLPFFIAGSLQQLSTILYGKLFRDYDLPLQNS